MDRGRLNTPGEHIQRRPAVIVAADVAGYSRLMGMDEEGTFAALRTHLREHVEPLVAAHGGRIFKTMGDGLLMEFASVADAVRSCVELQSGMMARNAGVSSSKQIRFRIGINRADVIAEPEGDIFGDGVNVAARLESIADPGGICISQSVAEEVRANPDLNLVDCGLCALKNIENPIRVFRIGNGFASGPEAAGLVLPPRRPSLAILPFRDLSGDPEKSFVADGIALGIQTLLVRLSGLFFVNACDHRGYREGTVGAAEAAASLGVRYVLEGAVQCAGERVRVTTRLTDTRNSEVVWADKYDHRLEDIFTLQDAVTREVVAALGTEMHGSYLERLGNEDLTGRGAWQPYLLAVNHFYKYTAKDNAIARQMFEKLHEMHPDHTLGAGAVALTHWLDATRGFVDDRAASLRAARDWAERSLEPEEGNVGLSHAVLGSIRILEHRHDEGLALCRKSVAFRANCPFAIGQLAFAQVFCGDAASAVKSAREALAVRMIYPPPVVNTLAIAHRDNGQIDLSIPAAEEAVRLAPTWPDGLVTLCSDLQLGGDEPRARDAARKVLSLDPTFTLSAFATRQPYRDPAQLDRVTGALAAAGLPA